jgi:hypothetical protein
MSSKTISHQISFCEIPRLLTLFAPLCLGVCLALSLTACGKKRSPPPEDERVELGPVSDALKVDLFFDATLSMKGFVLTETTSSYQQAVPLLERGVIEGWNGGQATFYKFGDDIAPLPGRKYLNAAKPTFYGDSKYNKKTLIERVIEQAEPEHLTVIVTDLFQDNADVNQLSERLKQKFIAHDLAVGVYAVRSQFAGRVYDVGPDNYSFDYKSGDNSEKYRPFYLLAFGSHADIAHYFDVLAAGGLGGPPESNVIIFSRHLIARPASFYGAKLKSADKISEVSASNLLSGAYKGDRVKAFKISSGKALAKFGLELPYNAALANVMRHGGELTPEVSAWKGEDTGAAELKLVENPQAQKAIQVSAQLLPQEGPFSALDLRAELKVAELPAGGVYRYRVQLRPSRYALPDWVAAWNMRDDDIKAWHLRPQAFDGSKTYNLENFLGTLQGAVLSTTPPEVCDVYFYIRVDR